MTGDVAPMELHGAGARLLQPENTAQQYRLARSGTADDAEHLALLDRQVEVSVHDLAPEHIGQAAYFDHGAHQMSIFMNSTANSASARITRKIASTTASVV